MEPILLAQSILAITSPCLWLIKNEKWFRLIGALIPFLWGLINVQLGLMDSAIVLFVISMRALSGLWLMNKALWLKTLIAIVFVAFFSLQLLFTYVDKYSWLPWFAASLTTIVQLYLKGIPLRLTQSLGADGAWIVYDWIRQAWGHLFEKSVGIVLNAWTVSKLYKKVKNNKQ